MTKAEIRKAPSEPNDAHHGCVAFVKYVGVTPCSVQIARLKRDSSNSSKPPSSDIVKPKNKGTRRGKRKRKIGGQKGHPRHERIPFPADDIGPVIP